MKTSKQWTIFSAVLASLGIAAYAQVQQTTPVTQSLVFPSQIPIVWRTQAWTKPDEPYQTSKTSIDKKLADEKAPTTLVENYRELAKSNPRDPKAQFDWAYAAYALAKKSRAVDHHELDRIGDAMMKANPANAYEYTRMLFLVEASADPGATLRGVAERLLQQQPKDVEVKFFYVRMLSPIASKEEKELALAQANDLIALSPGASSYSALGDVYTSLWRKHLDLDNADKAIDAYQQALKLLAQNDPDRPYIEQLVKHIEFMKDWEIKDGQWVRKPQ